MTEFFSALVRHGFLQNALLAGVLAGVACGVVGSYVVVRRITSIAGAIAHCVLAGLGAALALAHPLTVVTAIIASPLTSLNPMIAAGWVAGLMEAFLRRPKVKDFENLPEDISSLKGFWKNKITRILMVVVFTNLGSSLGAFVAIPLMVKVLA